MTARPRRGFTLIEVLLATFIIALGVLGLLALFAGAARQQQTSNQQSVAVVGARNAEPLLLRGFGSLQASAAVTIPDNVWIPLPMNQNHLYLGSPPGTYFLAPPTETLPRTMYTLEDPGGVYTTPSLGITPVWQFTGPPIPPYNNGSANFTFPSVSIDPDSIRIQVDFRLANDPDNDGTPDPAWNEFSVEYTRSPGATYASDPPSGIGSIWILTRDGLPEHDPADATSVLNADERDFIFVDVQQNGDGTIPASISQVHFGAIGSPLGTPAINTLSGHVTAITLLAYTWRNNQLVSLSDRLVRRADPASPDGQRPDQAYSLFFRRTATGSQAAIVSYQLTAPSSSARFIPPETQANINSNISPIRRANVTLRYDDDEDAYYIRITDEQLLWTIVPGQVILVEGDPTVANEPGSDGPVRIVRQVRETTAEGGRWRGYLDRGPRALDRAIMHPSQTQRNIRILAVADSVTSRDDSSVWKLTPLRISIVPVSLSN